MRGIVVTNGVDFGNASPLDLVMDSRLRGGMKNHKKLTIDPAEFQFDSAGGVWYGAIPHTLNYVPAVICYQDGLLGVGWQNTAIPAQPSANADQRSVYFQAGSDTPLTIIIFGEKVSDV